MHFLEPTSGQKALLADIAQLPVEHAQTSPFTGYLPLPRYFIFIYYSVYIYIYVCCVVLQGCPSPITFYELDLFLVICPFPDTPTNYLYYYQEKSAGMHFL
jgi:hypothetical protein